MRGEDHRFNQMGKISLSLLVLVLVLVACYALLNTTASGFSDEGSGGGKMEEGGGGKSSEWGGGEVVQGDDWFLLRDSVPVIQTFAGNMRVVKGTVGIRPPRRSPMHIGFITMEPNSLFIPQYLGSNLILFLRLGEAKIGHIYKDELVEKKMKTGDVYVIEPGSAFYIVNTAEGQRLQIICSIDNSENLGLQWIGFQSFFVGGGIYPTSVLAGFDRVTMATALNVTLAELGEMLSRQRSGAIVYLSNTTETPSIWSKFLDLEHHQRQAHLKRIIHSEEKSDQAEEKESRWSWRKLLLSVFGDKNRKGDDKRTGAGPDSYNLYDRKADFKNDYGWSKALYESDYAPLGDSDIGVYLVFLEAGTMMAPHINPRAIEFGIALEGNGTIQIVYPNGTLAMNAKVSAGDVFWVPKYFPFCQIASRTAPFVFFGFTTSARNNWPQFLVGKGSLLQLLLGPELASAFGIPLERLRNITSAQQQTTILPSPFAAEPEVEMKIPKMIKSFGNDMFMGFD